MWIASLKKEKLPEGIAQATIRPIYKGGVKSNPANCWSVALTDHFTNLFEKIIKKNCGIHWI